MTRTARALGGMVVAPHHLAAESGLAVLREGGNAIEALVAAAATIAVVYPHMNGIGGDGFWLLRAPGEAPVGIDASGAAGARATAGLYSVHGHTAVPPRGALAANTVAGAVSGWDGALRLARAWDARLPLARLLEDAIRYAEDGVPLTAAHAAELAAHRAGLEPAPGFAETFLADAAEAGAVLRQPRLGASLRALAGDGLDSLYRGPLARRIAADLEAIGAPVTAADLAAHRARRVAPLSLALPGVTLYNLPPPSQGLASLLILGVFARLGVAEADGFAHVHGLVEATKRAFRVRDRVVTDPDEVPDDPAAWLHAAALGELVRDVDPLAAAPWPMPAGAGDTVWLGAVDRAGRAASTIQSLYWEFGSGAVLPETGILWQNRGASFSLAPNTRNPLAPGRKPFHTLNTAMALFDDGRTMVYGAMGGDGQPQTQAALFTRYALYGRDLAEAIAAPRWLLGRTWGAETATLKIESDADPELLDLLGKAGHAVEPVLPLSPLMGHAGALVRHAHGVIEGASDPRCDGAAAAL